MRGGCPKAALARQRSQSHTRTSHRFMDPEVYQGMRNPNIWTAPGIIVGVSWVTRSVGGSALCLWRVLSKAGRPGWAAWVPFYNLEVLVKIVGKPAWWAVMLAVPFVQW